MMRVEPSSGPIPTPRSQPEREASFNALLDRISEHLSDARYASDRKARKLALVEVQFAIHDAMSVLEELQ